MISSEERLARIVDRDDITRVLYNYMDLLDRGEFDQMAASAFTEDAVEDHGIGRPIGHGRAEIAQARRQVHSGAGTMHVSSNVMIDFLSPDEANVQSYIRTYVWSASEEAGPRPVHHVLAGLFLDRFVRTEEGWRIAHRRRRHLGSSALALGEMPPRMVGTSGPREAPTMLPGYEDAFVHLDN